MTQSQPASPNPEDAPLEAELPGFLPGRSPMDLLDPNTTTTRPLTPPAPAMSGATPEFRDDGEEDFYDDEDERDRERFEQTNPRPEPGSSRSSSRAPIPSVVEAAAGLFALIASVVSVVLDATIGHGSGAYRMYPEEANSIGQPLGRMAARRVPVGDAEAGDVADGIEAGVAATAYAARATIQHFSGAEPPADLGAAQ